MPDDLLQETRLEIFSSRAGIIFCSAKAKRRWKRRSTWLEAAIRDPTSQPPSTQLAAQEIAQHTQLHNERLQNSHGSAASQENEQREAGALKTAPACRANILVLRNPRTGLHPGRGCTAA